MSFDRAIAVILELEGGLSDHPRDTGGVTAFGISARFGATIGLTADDVRALTVDAAKAIYREHFWAKLRCDAMARPLALCVLDCGINQGVGTAAKLLQRALGVTADGIVGRVTLGAVLLHKGDLLTDFMARRALRYASTSGLEEFGRGWYSRLLCVHRVALSWMDDNGATV